ncbi:SGNH/GDSL hydrolase family protein [Coraliomargarita parva]|uniref:SGNH/GDSL hydrolase family protein n=1 Tax=Coraliomargarita parva TaxID=3014050 RepID=UPI0022B467E7|nr:GDSL-type esterase/lipase family protein [Coraliomargarita parva]
MNSKIEALKQHIESDERTRILAFGSSNTERRLPGMHWFDCFELALHQRYGAKAHCINTGIGGHTTRDLLGRFESDAAYYKPHAVFITIGGNDCKPEEGLTLEVFETNLTELWRRFDAMGTHVIFQTYYAVMSDGSLRYQNFYRNMDVVRKVAEATGASLIDHLTRWEPLRLQRPELYEPLMDDAFHVNTRGNCVMGLDIARRFGWELRPHLAHWAEAILIQQVMDQLAES